MDTVIKNAEQAAPVSRPRATAAKVDYSSMERAGKPHRARVTEAERKTVREDRAAMEEARLTGWLRTVDPSDPEMAARYGLT